jgi:sulfur carrier protein ThiS
MVLTCPVSCSRVGSKGPIRFRSVPTGSVLLRLPPHLTPLLSRNGDTRLAFEEGTWDSVAEQIRFHHPVLARRVLTTGGDVAPGVALVVNDEIVSRPDGPLRLRGGDVIALISVLAGG